MIIDCHAHAYQGEVARKLIPKIGEIYGVKPETQGTVTDLLNAMGDYGIDRAIVLAVANKPEFTRSQNDFYIEIQDSHPELICFGSVHPDMENVEDEIHRIRDSGLQGVKLQPNAQRFYPDSEKAFRIYETLSELKMALVFHAGDEVKPFKPLYAHPKHLRAVLESFTGIQILLAHLGGYRTWDSISEVLDFRNAWYDTAFIPGNIPDEEFKKIVDEISLKKVVFGTDFPWTNPGEEKKEIERIFTTKAAKILRENPKRFLDAVEIL